MQKRRGSGNEERWLGIWHAHILTRDFSARGSLVGHSKLMVHFTCASDDYPEISMHLNRAANIRR